jgi:hypothetical protein
VNCGEKKGQSFGAAILSVRLSFLGRTPRKGKMDSKSCLLTYLGKEVGGLAFLLVRICC